jgi:hypothetical protein
LGNSFRPGWQSKLSRVLVRDIRTIRRWKTWESSVPKVVEESYSIEGGKLVETWLSIQPIGSSWPDTIGGEPYQSPKLTSCQEILDLFDRNVAAAKKAITAVKDDHMTQPWSLLKAGTTIFTMPRAALIRGFVLNHLIHHRAILCVYLRLNNISVPGMYDPSGDE